MSLLRIWSNRYCPVCGGTAGPAKNPAVVPKVSILAGLGEGPVLAGLVVGLLASAFFGSAVAIVVGIAFGAGILITMVQALVRYEREHLIGECEACGGLI